MNPESHPGPQSPQSRSGGGSHVFRSLKYRDYRLLWFGAMGGASGQWLEQIAVGWLVLTLTDSALWVGVAAACRGMPSLLCSPIGGVLADRFERKTLVAISQGGVAIIAASMAFLNFTGVIQLWHVLLLTVAFGSIWSMNAPARLSMIPDLVPRADLLNAVALNFMALNVARALGPLIAGVVLATLGFGELFALAALFYALIVVTTLMIRVPVRPKVVTGESFVGNITEGVRYLRGNRALFTVLACALFVILVGMPFVTLIPVFARDVLDVGELGLGMMAGAAGVGSLIASFGMAMVRGYRRPGVFLVVSAFVFGLSLIAFGLSEVYVLSLVILLITGAANNMYITMNQTVNQMLVSDAMRGRVTSILLMEFGLVPLGAIAAGAAAEVFSPGTAVAAMGVIISIATIAAYFGLSELRRIDISSPRPSQ